MASTHGISQIPDSLADFQFQTLQALYHGHLVAFVVIFTAIAFTAHLILIDMLLEKKAKPHAETFLHTFILQIKKYYPQIYQSNERCINGILFPASTLKLGNCFSYLFNLPFSMGKRIKKTIFYDKR